MKRPYQWTPGDPITAERMNSDQAEASRSRRDIALGSGSSMVNEALGNQSANMRKSYLRLAVAIENFQIQPEKTDLAHALDDVPSGLCQWFRLNRKSGIHVEDTLSTPFRVYDVLGGLNNQVGKVTGEFFYCVYNEDSKRWEILQSSGVKLAYGIVGTCLGDGWYEVELSDWEETPFAGSESASLSVSASVSDDPCDLCAVEPSEAVLGDSAECDTIQEVSVYRNAGAGIGEIVYAHTCSLIPLLPGSLVKMLKRSPGESASDSASASGSQSSSVSDDIITDRLYDVVDASKPLLSLPFPQYECCTLPDGSREVRLVKCDRAIVEGVPCFGEPTPCPSSDSASLSESL